MTEPIIITYPALPTPETPESKLEKLRVHLRKWAKLVAEFAESPTATAESSLLMIYEDDRECPLGFYVTPDGEQVAILSGDGLGVGFRFQDLATIINELTRCAMDAARRKGTTNLIQGIRGAFGEEEAGDIVAEASNFLQGQRGAQEAARKAELEQTAQKIQDMVSEIEKITDIAAGAVREVEDVPETSAEADATKP